MYKVIEDMVAYNIDYQPNPDYTGLHGDLIRLGLDSSEVQCIMRRVADADVPLTGDDEPVDIDLIADKYQNGYWE